MDAVYYVAMLVGVAWLAIWSILPEAYAGKGWWPFDMAEDNGPPRQADITLRAPRREPDAPAGRGTRSSWRDRTSAARRRQHR